MAQGKHSVARKSRKERKAEAAQQAPETFDTPASESAGDAPRFARSHASASKKSKFPLGLKIAFPLAVVVIAVAVAFQFIPSFTHDYEKAAAEFSDIIAVVDSTNETITPMSELMAENLDKTSVKSMKAVLENVSEAQETLDSAQVRYDAVKESLDAEQEGAIAAQLEDAISARRAMLDYGSIVLSAGIQTYEVTPTVKNAWAKMLSGDSNLKKASKKVESGTSIDIKSALEFDKQALEDFKAAQKGFKTLTAKVPNVDFDAENNYLVSQVSVATAAVALDTALLEDDNKTAEEHLKTYDKEQKKAVEAAEKLPSGAAQLIESVYYSFGSDTTSVKDAESLYTDAAKRAASDDVVLTDYAKAKETNS